MRKIKVETGAAKTCIPFYALKAYEGAHRLRRHVLAIACLVYHKILVEITVFTKPAIFPMAGYKVTLSTNSVAISLLQKCVT